MSFFSFNSDLSSEEKIVHLAVSVTWEFVSVAQMDGSFELSVSFTLCVFVDPF